MKTIMREYLDNKKALRLLILFNTVRIVYLIINARILALLAETITDIENLKYNLYRFSILCGIIVVLDLLETKGGMMNHEIFTSMCEKFTRKILDSDYEMFIKFSCSSLNTTFEGLWHVSRSGELMVECALSIINIIILLGSIYLIYPRMVLPISIVYGILLILCRFLFNAYSKMDEEIDTIKRSRNQEISEVINGFAEVRGFCAQEKHKQSILSKSNSTLKLFKRRNYVNAGIGMSLQLIDAIGAIIAILIIAKGMVDGSVTQAIGVTLVMYVWRLRDPIISILNNLDNLSADLTHVKRYDEVIGYENHKSEESIDLIDFENDIRVENLSFAYSDSETVLNNVSMTIKKGQKIGICGSSGGGKTTLVKLLEKFYIPDEGRILIDNIDMKYLTADSVRGKMGMVHQDPHIFSGSIYENIVYGNFGCSEYEIIEACKKANIYDFIQSLPEKFQTQVGPKGLKLSGGQKQRIALARIFLSDPEIVLLDEATSALDNESEALIQNALDLFKDKTVITIAHRLSTIKDSDCIYVIENHKIVESGNHDELMKMQGRYHELVKISEKNNR